MSVVQYTNGRPASRMNTRRVVLAIAILCAATALALIGLVLAKPAVDSGSRPQGLLVRLAGFTNDARGTRLTLFFVSNGLPREIRYSAGIAFKERGAWQSGNALFPQTKIAPHQLSTFALTNPIEGT